MYAVIKSIDFCYGHRLTNYAGKCRRLHGHNGRVQIEVRGDNLDERGMLTDFGDISRLMKQWIDDNLDHQMILKTGDPAIDFIRSQGEPVYVIDENPTAEALAKLIYQQAHKLGLPVSRVKLWETADSCAVYSE